MLLAVEFTVSHARSPEEQALHKCDLGLKWQLIFGKHFSCICIYIYCFTKNRTKSADRSGKQALCVSAVYTLETSIRPLYLVTDVARTTSTLARAVSALLRFQRQMGRRHGVAGSPIDGATASVERVRYPQAPEGGGGPDECNTWLPGCTR
jgi:hypothetical protein